MSWFEEFHHYLRQACSFWVEDEAGRYAFITEGERQSYKRKQKQFKNRKARIMKTTMDGRIVRQHRFQDRHVVDYLCHIRHLVKQQDLFYVEEGIENRRATFRNEKLRKDEMTPPREEERSTPKLALVSGQEAARPSFQYQRLQAVRYADQWWNGHNPEYRTFDVDCTNYVSQCLRAGGAPMTGAPQRDRGWWYENEQWSYSWAVAHSLRWYLSGAETGLRAEEVSSADELNPGDVICYDFDGDGSWQHNTIVTAKDAEGMPLVNAHTVNRRRHYWSYEDSTAWTPDIQYKFFRIVDEE